MVCNLSLRAEDLARRLSTSRALPALGRSSSRPRTDDKDEIEVETETEGGVV